jgi:predicted RND superfamily exporter protein
MLFARFIETLIQYRFPIVLLALLLSALAFSPARRISFDRRIDRMFQPDDPRYTSYQDLKRWFGDSETSIVAFDDPQLFTVEGMRRLERFHQQIEQLEGVRGVVSLKNARRPSALWDSRSFAQQLSAGVISAEQLQREILDTRLYRGKLVSDAGQTAVLWVELLSSGDQANQRGQTIEQLRALCQQVSPPAVLAGGPVLVDEVFTNLEKDGTTLGVTSSLILTLVIALLFRNLRWVLLPLAVVQVTLLYTKATLVTSGIQLSMVSSPLVALVTVIGVATVVHITVRYREERLKLGSQEALRQTLLHIGPPVFWTCLTTLMGFAALTVSQVMPVRDFGLMMSIGAGLVFVSVVAITPALVLGFQRWNDLPGASLGERWTQRLLQRGVEGVGYNPKPALVMIGFAFLLCALGILRLQVATDFNENFRKNSPIVQSFEFLFDRIEGINALDILIPLPGETSGGLNQTLQKLRELQAELDQSPGVAHTLSLADMLDFVSQPVVVESGRLGGMIPRFNPSGLLPESARLRVIELLGPQYVSRLWNRQQQVTRIIVQAGHAHGADQKQALVESIEGIARKHFDQARVTGSFVLMVYLVQSLLADQWTTFLVSFVAILGMMAIAFRSFTLGLVALIPNVTPILMVLGVMGWTGMKINMASAMLASVSLGLSVDFSIHYLYRYLAERRQGKTYLEAIQQVHSSVGLAIVLANLALISGFLVLLLSSLIPTVHFGMLVSVAMMGGLLGNLFLLPVLLRFLDPPDPDQSQPDRWGLDRSELFGSNLYQREGDRREGDRREGDRREGDRREGDRREGDRREGD